MGGYFAQVRIGFGTVGCYDKKYQRTIWDCNGVVRFYGKAFIGSGSKVIVESKGLIEFGDNFNNTAGMTLICSERINFGKDVLIGWDTLIMDSDFHKVINLETTDTYKSTDAITIGSHVWVGCKVTILKGSSIGDDSIVASNACVVKAEKEKAVLLAGNPAKIKKRSISWNL